MFDVPVKDFNTRIKCIFFGKGKLKSLIRT